MRYIYFVIATAIIMVSCQSKSDKRDFNKLVFLDNLIEKDELSKVSDSLKTLKEDHLSHINLAYYQLLDTRVKDKTFYNFTSDSIISCTEEVFANHKNKFPRLYALSLMYQGIVRYRMGIADTTVLVPLKRALDAFTTARSTDNKNIYLCNLYVGLIHDAHNDVDEAYNYLKEAAKYAKISNDTSKLNFVYSELAWNRLKANSPKRAKDYIDTLKQFIRSNEDKLSVLYLYSAFLSYNKEYEKSIQQEKQYLNLTSKCDSSILYKIYYKMSNNYEALKDNENAFYYAKLANSYLRDTLNCNNFLLYKHLGDLALKANDLKAFAYAYKNAYSRLNESIIGRSDKKVLEIENKYNYTKIENEKLIAQKKTYFLQFIVILLLLLLIIGILLRNRHIIKDRNTRLRLENEKTKLENEEKQLQHTAFQKNWINSVYAFITDNSTEQMNVFYKLRMHNLVKKEKKLCSLIDNLENDYKSRMKKISTVVLDDYTFHQITNLSKEQAKILNDNEKLLLALIKCDLNYTQIATLLGSSYDSIRMRKKNILDKLSKKE